MTSMNAFFSFWYDDDDDDDADDDGPMISSIGLNG